jgi:hypothetical protein
VNQKLFVRILTKGERIGIFEKIENLKIALESAGMDYKIEVSLNPDLSNPPIVDFEAKLTELEIHFSKNEEFIDSVEEHMLRAYSRFVGTNPDSWVWLMDDTDHYEINKLREFLIFLQNTDKKIIFLNNAFISDLGQKSGPRVLSLSANSDDLVTILLNSGPSQAASKLGAWIIRADILEETHLETWRNWLSTTVLWTHVYFYLYLLTLIPNSGFFYDDCFLFAKVNPTDTDRHKNWIDWHARRNKIFQQDWTIGQEYLLRYLSENKLLEPYQVRGMVISCAQRGIIPFINDLMFRLIINQLPDALFSKKFRLEFETVQLFQKGIINIYPELATIMASAASVLADSGMETSERLYHFKRARYLYSLIEQDPWELLRSERLERFDIYRRQTGFFGIFRDINPNILFRDSSEVQFNNTTVKYDTSQESLELSLLSDRDFYTERPIDILVWRNTHFLPFMRLPRIQILALRLLNYMPGKLRNKFLQAIRSLISYARQ